MDWRNRHYYLIKTSPEAYEMRHRIYKNIETVKIHACMSKDYSNTTKDEYHHCWQEIISCDDCVYEALEYELRKAKRNDNFSNFIEITKEDIGQ